MTWVLSGPTTVSVEATDTDTGARRNVVFEVPEADEFFTQIVATRWCKSFQELAFLAAEENHG